MFEQESALKRFGRLFLRALPLLGLCCAALWLWRSGQKLSVDTVLSYTPKLPLLAALFLLLLYGLKSISLMLPVLLLDTVCGVLFPLPAAILVATLGTAVTLTIPYFIGRGAGPDMTEKLQQKHPRLRELRQLRSRNELFLSFLIRIIGILPCDVVSLYLGNTRMPFGKYLLGGVLGFMPDILTAVVAGMKADDRSSPWFWGAIVLNLLIAGGSTLFYARYRKRRPATPDESSVSPASDENDVSPAQDENDISPAQDENDVSPAP